MIQSVKGIRFATLAILLIMATFSSTSAGTGKYFSDAKLHPNCLQLDATQKLSAEFGMRLFGGARFYFPFGSSKAIQHISYLIFPRASLAGGGNGVDGSEKMCPQFIIKGFKVRMEGHGDHYLAQDCAVIKKGTTHCVVSERSEYPEFQKSGDGINTIVWSDNTKTMGVVACSSDGLHNYWYAVSFEPTLNQTMKGTIMAKMNSLGFNETWADTTSPSYDGCELFDPEENE